MTQRHYSSDPLELLRRAEDVIPPAGAEHRVAALLLASSSGAAGLGALSSSLADLGRDTAQSLLRRFVAWSLLPLAAGVVIGASGQALLGSKRAQLQPPPAARVVSVASAPAWHSSAELASTPPVVDSNDSSLTVPLSPLAASASKASASAALAQERAILDPARQKLAAEQPERALQFLEQHARRYPGGRLTEEREAMWVNALVSLGRTEQARARGAAFQRRFPTSLMLSSVKAALAANSAN